VINDLDGYREYINTIDFYHYSDDTVFRARYKGGIRFDPLYDKYTSGEDIFYAKSYIADGYSYYLSYDENWTLKFKVRYKILSDKRGDLDQEEAIVGWYCKQYENQQLSTIGQWRYFVAREDSLRRVPGDSLPPLPEISLQEFETTMKNQGKYPGRISSSMKKLEKYYLPTPYKD